MKIGFLDLKRELKVLERQINSAITKVVANASFMLGHCVEKLEMDF